MVDFTVCTYTARLGHRTLPGYNTRVKRSQKCKCTCLKDHCLHSLRAPVHDLAREISLSSSIDSNNGNDNNSVTRHISTRDNYLSPKLELHVFVYHGRL